MVSTRRRRPLDVVTRAGTTGLMIATAWLGGCTSAGAPGAGEVLDQVDRAYQTEINVALTNASKAQQNYAATHGSFATDVGTLAAEYGLNVSPDVTLTVVRADAIYYCVQATHEQAKGTWHISPDSPTPVAGAC